MPKQRVTKSLKKRTSLASRGKSGKKARRAGKPLSLMASAEKRGTRKIPFETAMEFFRPLKRPVTLRLDADVIAWFKKDGRRYQTRINKALRKVMEREMKAKK